MELKIAHFYPQYLNLYSDRGNILCLQKRLLWRGIESQLEEIQPGKRARLNGYDILCIGGGVEEDYRMLAPHLHREAAAELRAAIADGVTVLAIASGLQLLGRYIQNSEGEKTAMVNAVGLYTKLEKHRRTGNYMFLCQSEKGEYPVIAFENHAGMSYLEKDGRPLGRVLCGWGNNGEDKGEGLRCLNVFGSYGHGPLLPKNPRLADEILRTALFRKYGVSSLADLPDQEEREAFEAMKKRIQINGGRV